MFCGLLIWEGPQTEEEKADLAFRASNVDFINLMQGCLRLENGPNTSLLPQNNSKPFRYSWIWRALNCWKVYVWGHRKDLDEYYAVEDAAIEAIRTPKAGGATAYNAANRIQK